MARKDTAAQDALLILAILKRIPRSSWITSTEIGQALAESGREVPTRRLQRILRELTDEPEFGMEINTESKPYAYRRGVPDPTLASVTLSPQVSLLVRMAQEYLKHQLPAPLVKSLDYLFEEAQETLNESARSSRAAQWLRKVAFVPESVPMLPPVIKSRIFDAVSEALYRESKLEIDYVNFNEERSTGSSRPWDSCNRAAGSTLWPASTATTTSAISRSTGSRKRASSTSRPSARKAFRSRSTWPPSTSTTRTAARCG